MSNNSRIQFPTHKRKAALRRIAKLNKRPTGIITRVRKVSND